MSDPTQRRTGRRASLPAGAVPPSAPTDPTPVAAASPSPEPEAASTGASPATAPVPLAQPALAAAPGAETPEPAPQEDTGPAVILEDTVGGAATPAAPPAAPHADGADSAGAALPAGPASPAQKRSRERRAAGARTTRPPRDRRRIGRILLAAATVAVLGGTVAASSLVPLPKVDVAAVRTSVTPSAGGLRLGCAGPLLQLAESAPGDSAAVSALKAPVRASGASAGLSVRPLAATLQGTDARAFAVESAPDPEGAPVLGSAAQSQFGSAGLVGLVASACAVPAANLWLVGGSTEVGRTTLLNLLNPTEVAAVVDLTLIGEAGPVTPPGASGIGVPAGEQVVVPLSGLAPDVAAPVVQVESRGGRVVATLQQSIVRGIEAGGVDTVGATAAPAVRQVIPGLRIKNSAGLAERMSVDGFGDLAPTVRLFVPGDEHTQVRIGVVPDGPRGAGSSLAFDIEPEQVVDVPLEGLTDGSYTLTIDADLPVVAAVRSSFVSPGGATDLAWLAAAEPLPAGTETWVSVTPGPAPGIYLHNPGQTRVTGTLTGSDGVAAPIAVEPGATVVIPAAGGQTYRLQGDGELRGAVSYLGDGGIAGYPVQPPPTAAAPVTVYPD